MALPQPETRFINDTISAIQQLLNLKTQLETLNSMYQGSPNYLGLLTQTVLDGSQFAGMQQTDLANAEYQLAQVLTALSNNVPSLSIISKWG